MASEKYQKMDGKHQNQKDTKHYFVISYDPKGHTISSKYVDDISQINPPLDYLAIHNEPFTQSSISKINGQNCGTWVQFFVLNREELDNTVLNEQNSFVQQMIGNIEVTLIRTKSGWNYFVKDQLANKDLIGTKVEDKDVAGFFCICYQHQYMDKDNQLQVQFRVKAGTDFHLK